MTNRKPRTRISPLRKELDEAKARVALLETNLLHLFEVGKGIDAPCRRCSLPLSDKIHRDAGWRL